VALAAHSRQLDKALKDSYVASSRVSSAVGERDAHWLTRRGAPKQVSKLLLLGAGESGKSTIFKQLVDIYGKGYSEGERKAYISIIYNNITLALRTLCEQSIRLAKAGEKTQVHPDLVAHRDYFLESKNEEQLDPSAGARIKSLWSDPGIQRTYELRARFQLTDSTAYFLSNIDTITQPSYIPSTEDIVRARVRTTGVVERRFTILDNEFAIYDVGGQRNERKKWIHCFSDVTAVIFVAAMHEYDMVLFEGRRGRAAARRAVPFSLSPCAPPADETTNRMVEALNLFDQICNLPYFAMVSIILFLNKVRPLRRARPPEASPRPPLRSSPLSSPAQRDLFAEKIVKVPLTVCFPDYKGGMNFDEGAAFIARKFESLNRSKKKIIYTHITCATDKDNVRHVFTSVRGKCLGRCRLPPPAARDRSRAAGTRADIVVRNSLREGGLLPA
jgi:GTPase SAR1 family protein